MMYLVVIDGAGEFGDNYSAIWVNAVGPEHAVEIATAPENGYGKNRDGIAFVAEGARVNAFTINDTTHKAVKHTALDKIDDSKIWEVRAP